MASLQYQCKSCGQTHDAPTRPEGTLYLRCVATREWAWYEPSSFIVLAVPRARAQSRTTGDRSARHEARAGGARASAAGRRRAPARASRRRAPRKTARASRKRR